MNEKVKQQSPSFPLSKMLWKRALVEYSKPDRSYHNAELIEHGWTVFGQIYVKPSLAQELAWIAHAVVLDPTGKDASKKSAVWLEQVFKPIKLDFGERSAVREAKQIIESLTNMLPKVDSAKAVIDVSLQRMSLPWKDFESNTWRLKDEAPKASVDDFVKKSQRFCQELLSREQIFNYPEAKRRWERKVRENLATNIEVKPLSQNRLFGVNP